MSIVDQIHSEAQKQADSKTAEVFQAAGLNLVRSRFARLRKRQTEPMNARERAYMAALKEYVHYKVSIHRQSKKHGYVPDRMYLTARMEGARADMDRIEFDLGSDIIGKFAIEGDEVADWSSECVSPAECAEIEASLEKRQPVLFLSLDHESIPLERMLTTSSGIRSESSKTTLAEQVLKSLEKSFPTIDAHPKLSLNFNPANQGWVELDSWNRLLTPEEKAKSDRVFDELKRALIGQPGTGKSALLTCHDSIEVSLPGCYGPAKLVKKWELKAGWSGRCHQCGHAVSSMYKKAGNPSLKERDRWLCVHCYEHLSDYEK